MQVQVHSLDFNDFCDDEYSLIGIHTTLEDYKLAYLLNKFLQINFSKAPFSLDFDNQKENPSFSVYHFESTPLDAQWFLISNSFKTHKNTILNGLLLHSETKKYLIPEKKNVDFFIKIMNNDDAYFVSETIQKINKIPQIITSYSVDYSLLKSKEYLIF